MVLSNRERWIHYFSLLSIFGILERIPKEVIMSLAKKIRDERIRKMTDKEIDLLLGEMYEEQQAGRVVLDEILDRLLTSDNRKKIDGSRKKRFERQPFDIFFFSGKGDRNDLM